MCIAYLDKPKTIIDLGKPTYNAILIFGFDKNR